MNKFSRINLGPWLWIASIQYFIVQIVAASAWGKPFSIFNNTISDLGNTQCALYGDRFVCSPLHTLMNLSFGLLGITMFFGAILLYENYPRSKSALVGFGFMGVAGIGTLLVGFFPENTVAIMHVIGAALPFLIGNIGMVILGFGLNVSRKLRIYTAGSGLLALFALLLFLTHNYLGLGGGGTERIIAYPQTIWLIIFGVSSLRQKI